MTGATRGIGHAIAARLAADGARVIGTGARTDGRVPEGCDHRAVDFTDRAALEILAGEMAEIGVDILINNAGINKIAPFADIEPDDFERIHSVNLTAPYVLCRALLPGMRAKGWGRIVNITSIWSKISRDQRGSYSASKFGLDGMTAALAAEVAKDGILANCVAPGFIDTDLTRRVLGTKGMAEITARVPAGRLGTPGEVAALVAWLAGPENTYVSGQNISIDGGAGRV